MVEAEVVIASMQETRGDEWAVHDSAYSSCHFCAVRLPSKIAREAVSDGVVSGHARRQQYGPVNRFLAIEARRRDLASAEDPF
jgi:hypothetical protein